MSRLLFMQSAQWLLIYWQYISCLINVHKKVGDAVKTGDVIATLYTNKEQSFASAKSTVLGAVTVSQEKPCCGELIYAVVR